jgi:hypothetical protein
VGPGTRASLRVEPWASPRLAVRHPFIPMNIIDSEHH